jgi:DNA-directed RNA polymerase subunit RPC12/RpoP
MNQSIGGEKVRENKRLMVTIRCLNCGERFFLKGRVKNGKVETGFKRCLCDNETNFEIRNEPSL